MCIVLEINMLSFNVKKFEVGYEDEMIGIYYSETEDGAIKQCREDMGASEVRYGVKFQSNTAKDKRLYPGLFARQVDY
jgi:hypothetical protein